MRTLKLALGSQGMCIRRCLDSLVKRGFTASEVTCDSNGRLGVGLQPVEQESRCGKIE